MSSYAPLPITHALGDALQVGLHSNQYSNDGTLHTRARNADVTDNASLGSICEAQWLQELECCIKGNGNSNAPPLTLHGIDFSLDDQGIHLPDVGNPFHLPNESIANDLFLAYRNTVHFAYPLLTRSVGAQLHTYYLSVRNQRSVQLPPRWFAIVNLVFAIGARYSRLIDPDLDQDASQATIYVSRAYKLLGLNETAIVLSDPDHYMVQVSFVCRGTLELLISLREPDCSLFTTCALVT